MEYWVETNNTVFCSSCSVPTWNLQKWYFACRERGIPQTRCSLWSTISFPHYNPTTTIERAPLIRHQGRAEELWWLEPRKPSTVPNNGT